MFKLQVYGQDIPLLYPNAHRLLSTNDALQTDCFEQVFIDPAGRMWLAPCAEAQRNRGLNLIQFDGKEGDVHQLGLESGSNLIIGGVQNDSILVGCELTYNQIVLYNLHSSKSTKISLADEGMALYGIHVFDGRIFALAFGQDRHEILELEGDKLFVRNTFEHFQNQDTYNVWDILKQSVVIGDQIWFTDRLSTIYCYSIEEDQIKSYQEKSIESFKSANLSNWSGKLLISLNDKNNPTVLSFNGNSLYTPKILPEGWKYSKTFSDVEMLDFIYTDSIGWLYIHCTDQNGHIRDILINKHNKILDYSKVFNEVNPGLYAWMTSTNFAKRVSFLGGAFNLIEISSNFEIKRFDVGAARAMVKLDEDRILCLTDIDPVLISIKTNSIEHLSSNSLLPINPSERKTILLDQVNRLWFIHKNTIYSYDLNTGNLMKFPWVTYIDEFAMVEDRILFISQLSLYWLDPSTSLIKEINPSGALQTISGYTNEILVSNDSIWIATSKGLFSFNEKTSLLLYHQINNQAEIPLLTIFQDKNEMLMLGTEYQGIIRYDPTSQLTEICDRKNGLPHNTVVGILEDERGNFWANTFSGVAVINSSLDVIAAFNKESGLVDNEGNRWSNYNLGNGQLIFGTVSGLSVISTELTLKSFQEIPFSKIYIKSVTFPEPTNDGNTYVINPNTKQITFNLPPDRRTIELDLGTSAYIENSKNSYFYKIEHPAYDWVSLGNQSHVVLTNLPTGQYEISVRAKDANGIWTSNIENIRLHVRKFFYTQWWFFMICSTPFIGFLLLWLWRNSKEKTRLEGEVQKRTITIEKQTEELRQLDQAKTRIYTNITHEFRTPLTIIKGTAEQIEENEDKKHIIRRSTDRLLNLVNQLLELSKLESGSLEVKMVQIEITQLFHDIFESFTPIAEDKDIGMHFYSHQSEVIMDCEIEIVHRIFGNLLSNAIKFTPSGGHIYVEIQKTLLKGKEFLNLSVRDTGVGIPEDKINAIFSRFYQVDNNTTRTGEGTGIGLALTKELVEILSGSIQVKSDLGVGSTFSISLPISRIAELDLTYEDASFSDILASSMATNAEWSSSNNSGSGDSPRILIVEDNPDIIHYLMNCLQGSYRVHAALDGIEGVEKAQQLVPELIISDVMMPGKDGIQLCSEVKADERTSHIPIILLTAKADINSKIEGLERGADAYMSKPFEKAELILVVRNLILSRQTMRDRYLSEVSLSVTDNAETKVEDLFMHKLNLEIQEHLDDEDYDVTQLCRSMKYSRSQIHNKVKALTGLSTSAYIQHKRMQHAKLMLSAGEMNISEVAYAVGFRDPNYFSRTYRKEFGMTPSEFLQQNL